GAQGTGRAAAHAAADLAAAESRIIAVLSLAEDSLEDLRRIDCIHAGHPAAGRSRGPRGLYGASSGRGEGAGDPHREAPPPTRRPLGTPVRSFFGDCEAVAARARAQRDRGG